MAAKPVRFHEQADAEYEDALEVQLLEPLTRAPARWTCMYKRAYTMNREL